MPDLQDIYRLRAFVTVVQEGSLSAAVNKLHITQPALSARLKLLEESMGCLLLERTSRGVRPTAIGKIVYSIAQDILHRMERLRLTVENHLECREGVVHLGGTPTATACFFPKVLEHFSKKYPHVQFTLCEKNSQAVAKDLLNDVLDIGLMTDTVFADSLRPGLTVHFTIPDELYVIASPQSNLARMAKSLEREDKCLLPLHLNKQPCVFFESTSPAGERVQQAFQQLGIRFQPTLTLQCPHTMVKMVERNLGFSIVSKHFLADYTGFQVLKIQNLNLKFDILVCSKEHRILPPAALEFLKILKQESAD